MVNLLTIGVILVLLGLFLVFAHFLLSSTKKADTKFGGVIMLGPIPLVFGNDSQSALYAVVFAILILIAVYLFLFVRW